MFPKYHIIFGAVFAIIIFYIFPETTFLQFSIIFLSSVLIDVDHYLLYVFKKKDWSLKNAYSWHIRMGKKLLSFPRKKRNKFYLGFCFLHGFEILIILAIFSIFISKYFLFIIVGFAFHLFVDTIHQTTYWDRLDRVSVLYDYIKYKKLKDIETLNVK